MIVSYFQFLEDFFKPFFDFALGVLRVEFIGRPFFTYLIGLYVFMFVVSFISSHSVITGGFIGTVLSASKSETKAKENAHSKSSKK